MRRSESTRLCSAALGPVSPGRSTKLHFPGGGMNSATTMERKSLFRRMDMITPLRVTYKSDSRLESLLAEARCIDRLWRVYKAVVVVRE